MALNGEIIDLNDTVRCNHPGSALGAQAEGEEQQLKTLL